MMTSIIVPVGGQIVYCEWERGVCVYVGPIRLALEASHP